MYLICVESCGGLSSFVAIDVWRCCRQQPSDVLEEVVCNVVFLSCDVYCFHVVGNVSDFDLDVFLRHLLF